MPIPFNSIIMQRLEVAISLWENIDRRCVDFKNHGSLTIYIMKNGSHARVWTHNGRVNNIQFFGRTGKHKSGMGVEVDNVY